MDDKARSHLKEHGWVVIPNVVDSKECDECSNQLFNFLVGQNRNLKRDDPSTWIKSNLPKGTIRGGMNRCAAHLQPLWDIRQHPGVVQIFADLYRVKPIDLVTSMDAWTVYNSKAIDDSAGGRKENWIHFDQGPQPLPLWPCAETPSTLQENIEDESKREAPAPFQCVQGYVTLEDADDEDKDGGLFLLDKGHRLHTSYFVGHKKHAHGNFHMLDKEFLASLDPLYFKLLQVRAKKGSVVLWYSTTPHQGRPPTSQGHDRSVVYVCQAPKQLMTEKDLKTRKEAWSKGLMTCHWPVCNNVKIFQGESKSPTRKIRLTDLGRSLLGFEINGNNAVVERAGILGRITSKEAKHQRKKAKLQVQSKSSSTMGEEL